MKFKNLIGDIKSHIKKEMVARKRQRGVDRYRRTSGEIKFSRLYAYRQTTNGVEVVEDEAKVVRIILGLLALGRSPADIKKEMDLRGARNGSGDKFCEDEIKRMLKPVYMGRIQGSSGKMVPSKHYPALVSPEIWKKAQKSLKRLTEGSKSFPPIIGERVVLTLAEGRGCPNTKWDFLDLP